MLDADLSTAEEILEALADELGCPTDEPPLPPPDDMPIVGVEAAPPPPPPPPAPALGGAGIPVGMTAVLPWGRISWYRKGVFETVCRNRSHGRCVLTRKPTAFAAGSADRPRGGRPLGFMAAWLQLNEHLHTTTGDEKAKHWEKEAFQLDLETRQRCREALRAAPGGSDLLTFERPRWADEPEEPEVSK